MSKSRQDIVGELAEKELDRWASQAGITINPSREDRKGWDYILEFRLRDEEANVPTNTPLDKDLREVKAFVQVKGSDNHDRVESISLTNWRSLVSTPHPTYILRVEFDGESDPQRAYLRHVDRDITRRVLKRLRKMSADDSEEALHKKTRQVSFNQSHQLDALDGSGLRSKLIEPLGGNPRKYEVNKRAWITESGYSDSTIKMETTVRIPDEYKEDPTDLLVDFAAGIVPELDLVEGQIYDTRFDIPVPQKTIKKGKLRPERRFTDGVLAFATVGRRFDRIRVPVRVQQSSLPANEIPSERLKIQMHGPGLRIVATSEHGRVRKFDLSVDPYGKWSLSDFKKTARLIDYLLEKARKKEQTSISFTHNGEGGSLGVFSPGETEKNSEEFAAQLREVRELIRHAIALAREADMPMNAEVKLAQLDRQQTGLISLCHLISGDEARTFKLVISTEKAPGEEARIAAPIPVVASFGEWFVLAVVVLEGHPQCESDQDQEDTYTLTLVSNKVWLPLVVSVHADEKVPNSAEVVEIAIQRLERDVEIMPEIRLIPEAAWIIMDPLQAEQLEAK